MHSRIFKQLLLLCMTLLSLVRVGTKLLFSEYYLLLLCL